MPTSSFSVGSPSHTSVSNSDHLHQVRFVHCVSEAGRLLPSDSRWNSIELNFNFAPQSSLAYESIPSRYAKSVDYDLVITDMKHFRRFLCITFLIILLVFALLLLAAFLPRHHRHHSDRKNLTLAVNQALTFFDAQKSGYYPKTSPVKFRGNSGLEDGNWDDVHANLSGGFYDSGNNIKFSFPTAYTVTLLSWSVIEYYEKYEDIGELDHVGGANSGTDDDISCWQRPEDMTYPRAVSYCDLSASDLAGEIVAGLSAASILFKNETDYRIRLIAAAESLFELSTKNPKVQGAYTAADECGGQARPFYNSTSFKDELVWGGTWLFFATGNTSYLDYATTNFGSAIQEERVAEKGLFYWNNKVLANAVLLTRLLYFRDPGYPFEETLALSSNMTDLLICSYLLDGYYKKTPGGLILLNPDYGSSLELAATASFLSKLKRDYLDVIGKAGGRCDNGAFSRQMLQSFSLSQINYILGDNPTKMSYMVGFGHQYPTQVHHRSASIPWDGQPHSCDAGQSWLHSASPNPNILLGALVSGPDQWDNFLDVRNKPWYTEPSISRNAGLVAALIALHDPPHHSAYLGIDQMGMFDKIRARD
ncbi:hypothetical protein CDL15_Pgr027855 [Punica granatum]|uniref:Endoglucanase n=1 Tax=Punica granatum TaxID=22663 RepID=A0A218XJT6_PUNGR|nr:hypothetical protein CDL15_Pgr027855 [Punica granatum]